MWFLFFSKRGVILYRYNVGLWAINTKMKILIIHCAAVFTRFCIRTQEIKDYNIFVCPIFSACLIFSFFFVISNVSVIYEFVVSIVVVSKSHACTAHPTSSGISFVRSIVCCSSKILYFWAKFWQIFNCISSIEFRLILLFFKDLLLNSFQRFYVRQMIVCKVAEVSANILLVTKGTEKKQVGWFIQSPIIHDIVRTGFTS